MTWYINGVQVVDDATHKVLVNEAGNHSLMINKASLKDAGVITCVARNKSGEATFQVCHRSCNLCGALKDRQFRGGTVWFYRTIYVPYTMFTGTLTIGKYQSFVV